MGCVAGALRGTRAVLPLTEAAKDLDHTGEHHLAALPPEQLVDLAEHVLRKGKSSQIDTFTKFLVLLITETKKNHAFQYKGVLDICLPKPKRRLAYYTLEGLPGVRVPDDDEDWERSVMEEVFGGIGHHLFLSVVKLMPNSDIPVWFDSIEEGIMTFQVDFNSGRTMPPAHETYAELVSDEAISLIAFWGVGQVFLEGREEGGWQVDLTAMADHPVREGYERYGACAVFDGEQRLQSIYCCYCRRTVLPHEWKWEHAKWVWKTSLGVNLTGKTHLAQTHWIVANCAHLASREHLSDMHPVRRVLKVFLFNTGAINYSATSKLFPEHSVLHRSTAFTYQGMVSFMTHAVKTFKYETLRDFIASKRLGSVEAALPMVTDGLPVWDALHGFFEAYVGLFFRDDAAVEADPELCAYWACVDARGGFDSPWRFGLPRLSRQALADHLTHHAFHVTAWHEFVGSIVQYATTPEGLGTKIRPGRNVSDVQSFLQGLSLVAMTGLRQPPLLGPWEFLLPQEAQHLHAKLLEDLHRLSAEIDARNARAPCPARRRKVESFNPKYFECSVSA